MVGRPRKSIQGTRSGLTAEQEATRKIAKSSPSVRVKKTAVPKRTPAAKGIVNVAADTENQNENSASLFLHLNATNGIVHLSYEIPLQFITIKMTRCHFRTIQNAQTYPAIGICLSVFSPLELNNNLTNAVIPIMGDYSRTDVIAYPNVTLSMAKFLQQRPSYRIIDLTTGETIPDGIIDFVQILFEYRIATIN